MNNVVVKNIAFFVAGMILRLLRFSCRKVFVGLENFEEGKKLSANGKVAMATWHQNLFGGTLCLREKIISMTSLSKDGEVAAKVSSWIGNVYATRGSSSRGGRSAMEEMINIIKKKPYHAALTIDGPRGPSYVPKRGIFKVAHDCQMPIIPYFVISSKTKVLRKSWDKMRLGLPFATFYIRYGRPIFIKSLSPNDLESYSEQLTQALHQLEKDHFKEYPQHEDMIRAQE